MFVSSKSKPKKSKEAIQLKQPDTPQKEAPKEEKKLEKSIIEDAIKGPVITILGDKLTNINKSDTFQGISSSISPSQIDS